MSLNATVVHAWSRAASSMGQGGASKPQKTIAADAHTLFHFRFRGHSRHGRACCWFDPGRE
jgi:hypothetical protein